MSAPPTWAPHEPWQLQEASRTIHGAFHGTTRQRRAAMVVVLGSVAAVVLVFVIAAIASVLE